jgi:hypothetical protein
MTDEYPGVSIPLIQRVPTGFYLAVSEEIDEKRSLPVACSGGEEDQLSVEVFVEEIDKPRTAK